MPNLENFENLVNLNNLKEANLDVKFIKSDDNRSFTRGKKTGKNKGMLFEINKGRKGNRVCKAEDDHNEDDEFTEELLDQNEDDEQIQSFKKGQKYFFDLDDAVNSKITDIKLKSKSNSNFDDVKENNSLPIRGINYLNLKKNKIKSGFGVESEDEEFEDFEKQIELDDLLDKDYLIKHENYDEEDEIKENMDEEDEDEEEEYISPILKKPSEISKKYSNNSKITKDIKSKKNGKDKMNLDYSNRKRNRGQLKNMKKYKK
jgi:hypothetical protein